jgi:hypothetical protein
MSTSEVNHTTKCEFCQHLLTFHSGGVNSWECRPCGYNIYQICDANKYLYSTDLFYQISNPHGRHIRWEIEAENGGYSLSLFPEMNLSIVWLWHGLHVSIIKIPYLVQNVRPENVKEKIKTLVTFS